MPGVRMSYFTICHCEILAAWVLALVWLFVFMASRALRIIAPASTVSPRGSIRQQYESCNPERGLPSISLVLLVRWYAAVVPRHVTDPRLTKREDSGTPTGKIDVMTNGSQIKHAPCLPSLVFTSSASLRALRAGGRPARVGSRSRNGYDSWVDTFAPSTTYRAERVSFL